MLFPFWSLEFELVEEIEPKKKEEETQSLYLNTQCTNRFMMADAIRANAERYILSRDIPVLFQNLCQELVLVQPGSYNLYILFMIVFSFPPQNLI